MNLSIKIVTISSFLFFYSCQMPIEQGQNSNIQKDISHQSITTIDSPTLSPLTVLSVKETTTPTIATKRTAPSTVNKTIPTPNHDNSYHWLADYTINNAVQNQITVPIGYERISAKANSFGTWLRGLPLTPKNTKVLLYNGTEKPYQEGADRVLDIDIGKRDLQQCADAVMRLKAEYHYSQQDYNGIHFNYTSGHTIRFTDWSKGKKPKIKGSKVYFSSPTTTVNTSYKNFKKYLTNVYCYAGTASLSKELTPKKVTDILPGDVFIWGGFPGHAVLVIDVAQHQTTGKKIFLIAQSYMPAQSIHILKNLNNTELSPWYSEDFGHELHTPEWTFNRNALKTF